MPVIRVSQEVYRKIILEAGKRGCTISEAANVLFFTKLHPPVKAKQKPDGELVEDTIDVKKELDWLEE